MVNVIKSIAKIDTNIQQGITQFNSTLPMSITVVSQSGPLRYLLKIGNSTLSTKSLKSLDIGSSYWGILKNSKNKSINLSNLIKKPYFLQDDNIPFFYTYSELIELLDNKNSKYLFKTSLVQRLGKCINKNEFTFITNLLNALNDNIFVIPYIYDNNSNIFQFRYKKRNSSIQELQYIVDFFATFSNLGAIRGKIVIDNSYKQLSIEVQFEQSQNLLQSHIDSLQGFDRVKVSLSEVIQPIYKFKDRLLELSA